MIALPVIMGIQWNFSEDLCGLSLRITMRRQILIIRQQASLRPANHVIHRMHGHQPPSIIIKLSFRLPEHIPRVACIQCHTKGYTGTSTVCVDCHLAKFNATTKPNHKTLALSTACATCHTTAPGWAPASFPNHGTYYVITGLTLL